MPAREKTPLGRVSTTDALEDAIRDEVLRQGFPPGTPLREVEITERYGVGRNSVRAALQALVHSGLLRHAQHRGVFVPDFTVSDVRELFLFRRALELQAVRTVTRQSRPLDGVEEALKHLEDLDAGTEWLKTVEVDLALHSALVAAAGSARMARAFDGLVLELRLLLGHVQPLYPHPTSVVPGHHELVTALRDRDDHEAARLLGRHLDESEEQIVDAVGRSRVDGRDGSDAS